MPVNEWLPGGRFLRILFSFAGGERKERWRSGHFSANQIAPNIGGSGVRDMKSRENLVRLKQFQVNEKRRQVAQLDMMIAEFERMAGELEVQIAAEEKRSGITDVNHFAYPTFAKAARQRRDNLKNSQADLALQRTSALSLLREAEIELSKAQLLESRDNRMRDAEAHDRGAMIG
jgi:hypothetical protein